MGPRGRRKRHRQGRRRRRFGPVKISPQGARGKNKQRIKVTDATPKQLVSVCAYCEKELGAQKVPAGTVKTHSICRRHLVEQTKPFGTIDFFQKLAAKPDSSFCPDLAAHPELIEPNLTAATHEQPGEPTL